MKRLYEIEDTILDIMAKIKTVEEAESLLKVLKPQFEEAGRAQLSAYKSFCHYIDRECEDRDIAAAQYEETQKKWGWYKYLLKNLSGMLLDGAFYGYDDAFYEEAEKFDKKVSEIVKFESENINKQEREIAR